MSAVALQSFGFGEQLVRAFDREGSAWFVANDVCRALELANPRHAVSRLEEDEKDDVGISDAIGRTQQTTIVSESGVYALIFTSRKEAAKRFRRWVTQEVLPAIRATGRYEAANDEASFEPPQMPDEMEALRTKLAMVREARIVFGMKAARQAWRVVGLLPELTNAIAETPRAEHAIGVVARLHRTIAEWLEARTEAAPGHREYAQTLYDDYLSWAKAEEIERSEIVGLVAFGKALTNAGIAGFKSGRMMRIGLKLVA